MSMVQYGRGAAAALVFGLSATLAAATVRPVSNTAVDGRPVLVPSVQKIEQGKGAVALPAKFTVRLPDGEPVIAGHLAAELKRFPAVKLEPVSKPEAAFCRFILTEKDVPEHDQGYRLTVAESGIEIAARRPVGLFYGMQTLRNLLRNAEKPELPRLAIRDWPDFDRRGYCCTIRFHSPTQIRQIERMLDAMAALKVNWVRLDTSDAFPYQQFKLGRTKGVYTLEQMRGIVAYARDRHIEISPSMQIWSHSSWLHTHPDWAKMREGTREGWGCQICPLNEEARTIVEQAITEQVQLYGSKIFSPQLDEIYSGPFRSCPRCQAVPPEKLLRDYVKFLEGICRKLGVTMIVGQDSLENRYWKYGDALRDAFDSSTRICWWCYDDNLPMAWNLPVFRRFPLVGHALCGKPLNLHNMARLMRVNGSRECDVTHWYYSRAGGIVSRLEWETPESLGGFVNSFDYLWHFTETHYAELDYDGTYELMRLMYPEETVPPFAPGKAEPVPLGGAVNAELSGNGRYPVFTSDASTAALAKTLAGLPERFHLITSPGGKYYGIRLAGVPPKQGGRWCVEFGFGGRKAERLSFLLTASVPANRFDYGRCGHTGSKRFRYETAAALTLIYADGSREEAELKYRREITDWNHPFGGMKMRFAVRGLDDLDQHFNFGIFDLVNPHPEKPIKSIAFSTRRLDGISPVLLAVSARGVDRAFPAPGKIDPAAVAKRPPAQQDPPLPVVRVRQDFEHGIGEVKVSGSYTTHDQLSGAIRAEVVADPLSKTGNHALRVTVPPAINDGNGNDPCSYIRISIEMPCTIVPGTKSVSFRCRVSPNALPGLSHVNDYLKHEDTVHYWFQRVVPGVTWRTASTPFTRAKGATKPYEDKTRTALRRVSFFFWRIPETIELWFDDFGDSPDEVWVPWVAGSEAEPN